MRAERPRGQHLVQAQIGIRPGESLEVTLASALTAVHALRQHPRLTAVA